MIVKLNQILIFSLIAFTLSMLLFPLFIKLLKNKKIWQRIREVAMTGEDSTIYKKLHSHKSGTPTMGGGIFLIVMFLMVWVSLFLQHKGIINNSLLNRKETYVLLFGFFSMWFLWRIDDILNTRGHGKIKWLSAKMKLVGMFIFAGFMSRRFYSKLWTSTINFRPLWGTIDIGLFYPIFVFLVTISIVNAINITDWLDWLAWWLMTIILFVLAIVTFMAQTYIATAVIGIVIASLVAFLRYNINPAKIFMWDSGAFALWWLLSSLIFILNMRMGILLPFIFIFSPFILETLSSWLQIIYKKIFKKKLFTVAPFHHYLEHKWMKETSIVMKARLIQALLAAVVIIGVFYQMSSSLLN